MRKQSRDEDRTRPHEAEAAVSEGVEGARAIV